MNGLLRLLQIESDFSVESLKRLYRQLCKKTHPDKTGSDGDAFIRLRQDYEEALKLLNCKTGFLPSKEQLPNVREKVLKGLYLYCLKLFSKDGEKLLGSIIEIALSYRPDIAALLREYRKKFIKNFEHWRDDHKIFYMHSVFISLIKQLTYFHSLGIERHRYIFLELEKEMRDRVIQVEPNLARIMLGLTDWLSKELND